MIRHCVFVRFQATVSRDQAAAIFEEISALQDHLSGILAVTVGDNVSPEAGMDKGFDRGFTIDFDSPESRDAYLDHPAHVAAGAKLVAAAAGGAQGILVFDMEI